jgi:hypothetical protein
MKSGHVIIIDRYTRSLIMANPAVLFAFGDNLARIGYGGQAKEARGCLNAIGIPTKISPDRYIFDEDVEQEIDRFKWPISRAFAILRTHIRKDGTIVWPKDGVGTGLARLHITAPRTFAAIEGIKEAVFAEALSVTHQNLNQIEQGNI